jgi:hypothetical protein
MKTNLDALRQERNLLLQEMHSIERLRRGSLSQQFFRSARSGPSRQCGPYYVLQGYLRGQKFSERIPADQAQQVQQDVANYRRFEQLAEQVVSLSDQITRQQDQRPDTKKNSSRRKSMPNNSVKRKPS